MKKIKKLLTIGLALLLMLCMSVSLVGCKDLDKKTKWYSEKALSWGNLENLPKPTFQYKGYHSTFREITGDITENDFQQYAQQLLDYMYGKFEYLGTSGKWLQEDGWNPNCQFVRCGRNLEEYRKEYKNTENETCAISYLFVYFLEEPTEQNDGVPDYSTIWYVEITYYLTEQTYREKEDGEYKDKYTYNFSIQLKKYGVSTFYIYTDYISETHTEHTYEWVGSEGGHQKVYTCGCEYPDIVELHSDNNSDYVCDVCGWPMDGILPEIVPDGNQNQNDSNDIFYTASYPQDFEYNGRHYHLVQGVGLKTTVTQEELGELLGYIIREEDISAFTQEYPNVNYVIDNGIYDYETKNRVAFYSVKAYPDLSLICMNQLGEYVLFQDV